MTRIARIKGKSESNPHRAADEQTSQNLALFFDAFLGKIIETIA